jgi:hypothetical protein
MYNPTRDEARRFFFETWRKYRAQEPLSPLEGTTLDVILAHPEYHGVLSEPERFADRDYLPEQGETNPFLHLSMHLAIAEQLSIDQPPGIKTQYRKLAEHLQDEHRALHGVMDCLAETMWQAQRQQTAPDGELYLKCLEQQAGK